MSSHLKFTFPNDTVTQPLSDNPAEESLKAELQLDSTASTGFGTNEQMTENLLCDGFMYMPLEELRLDENTTYDLQEILYMVAQLPKEEIPEDFEESVAKLEAMAKNTGTSLSEITISNISGVMDSERYPSNGISGAVFHVNDQQIVAFRGTPSGAWVDNGFGLGGEPEHSFNAGDPFYVTDHDGNRHEVENLSAMDRATLLYIEELLESGVIQKGDNLNSFLTGHSKGGHEAQLAAIFFPEYFEGAYSFDGQGISPELWDEMVEIYGEAALLERRKEIISISADNDFVHGLGEQLVLEEQELLLKTVGCESDLVANHTWQAIVTEDGFLCEVNPDGEGPVADFIALLSQKVMELPPEDRNDVCTAVMILLQMGIGGDEIVNFDDLSLFQKIDIITDIGDGMGDALSLVITLLFTTEEGAAFREYLMETYDLDQVLGNLVQLISEIPSPLLVSLGSVLAACLSSGYGVGKIVLNVLGIVDNIQEGAETLLEALEKVGTFLQATLTTIRTWVESFLSRLGDWIEGWLDWLWVTCKDPMTFARVVVAGATGEVGMDYAQTTTLIACINDHVSHIRSNIMPALLRICDTVSDLEYTSVDTSDFMAAHQGWSAYCNAMETYAGNLARLKKDFEELENQFCAAMAL